MAESVVHRVGQAAHSNIAMKLSGGIGIKACGGGTEVEGARQERPRVRKTDVRFHVSFNRG
ncbi:hypothetical protein H6P81_016430 [Aristolochia fimbriata]|uniref:Uncharacterized protein n=1 Tax=Aristolochia fimbriata TaxID=158543 RepID=A0AAV7EAD2_ARIFI|nr:hypothetical protein H6P81_016430 [Aristolochia fimbriata]